MNASDQIVLASRGIVAGVLAVAAVSKFRGRAATRAALAASHLPQSLDRVLPLVEAFTALGLLVERRRAWAAYVALGLLVAFTVYLASEARRGSTTPCPCFGAARADGAVPGARAVVRNLVLVAFAVLATGRAGAGRWLVVPWAAASALVVVARSRRTRSGAPAGARGAG